MNNAQVAEAFAYGRLASGSHLYTEHVTPPNTSPDDEERVTVLISYATPIAFKLGNMVYFDERRYSAATSRQQAAARGAIPDGLKCVLSHEEFRRQCRELGIYLGGAR